VNNIIAEVFYCLIALIFILVGIKALKDKSSPTRIYTALFWFVLAFTFAIGPYMPYWITGVCILIITVLTAMGRVKPSKGDVPAPETTRKNADKLGYKVFVPAVCLALFAVLAATFAATLLRTMPYRKIGASGVAVLALAAYTAWGLVDFLWMLPVVYGVVLICHTGWFAAEPSAENTARVRTVFYLVLVPVLWVLAANIVWKLTGLKAHSLFFPPFAAALMAQLMISRVRLRGRAYSRIRLVAECCIFNLPLAAATLLAAGDWGERWLFAAGETAAVIATAAVYRHAFSRSRISPTALLRLRTALVLISSLLLMVLLLAHAELPEGWVR